MLFFPFCFGWLAVLAPSSFYTCPIERRGLPPFKVVSIYIVWICGFENQCCCCLLNHKSGHEIFTKHATYIYIDKLHCALYTLHWLVKRKCFGKFLFFALLRSMLLLACVRQSKCRIISWLCFYSTWFLRIYVRCNLQNFFLLFRWIWLLLLQFLSGSLGKTKFGKSYDFIALLFPKRLYGLWWVRSLCRRWRWCLLLYQSLLHSYTWLSFYYKSIFIYLSIHVGMYTTQHTMV
jgi:hypothetical protein